MGYAVVQDTSDHAEQAMSVTQKTPPRPMSWSRSHSFTAALSL